MSGLLLYQHGPRSREPYLKVKKRNVKSKRNIHYQVTYILGVILLSKSSYFHSYNWWNCQGESSILRFNKYLTYKAGIEIATDMVVNATNIFSLVTKNFVFFSSMIKDKIKRVKLKQTFHLILLNCFRHEKMHQRKSNDQI